jgi:hypothetical protein
MAFTENGYLPAHLAHCAIAAEVGTITEGADGFTPDSLPAIPASPAMIGYTVNLPEVSPNLNNRKGFGIGAPGALWDAPGSPRPSGRIELRAGSTSFLANFCQRDANGQLPYFALYLGVNGVFTDVYRFCKVNELSLSAQEGGEQGGEIAANVSYQGLARQPLGTPLAIAESAIRALGVPLMFHDVRSFIIPIAGVDTSFRNALQSISATLSHNLGYKGQRPNWGDNQAVSRGAYDLLEHHYNARAEIGLHKRLSRALFTGAVDAQQWGDIVLDIEDIAHSKALNLTLKDCLVTNETMRGVASGEQISHTVTVECSNIEIDDTPTP